MSGHSWQRIIDEDMVKNHNASVVMLSHIQGGYLLAASPGWWLPQEDMKKCIDVFDKPEHYMVNGITLYSSVPEVTMHFMVLKVDADGWWAKRGSTGCFCSKSDHVLIIAMNESPVLPGRTANAVDCLRTQLLAHKL